MAGNLDIEQVLLNVSEALDGSTVGGRAGQQRYVQQRTIDSIVLEQNLTGPFVLNFNVHGYELPSNSLFEVEIESCQ